jgi:hypothetical protein
MTRDDFASAWVLLSYRKTGTASRAERILPDAIGFVQQTSTPIADDFYFGGPSLLALPAGFVNRHVHGERQAARNKPKTQGDCTIFPARSFRTFSRAL